MSRKEKHIDLIESEQITLREGAKYHPKVEFREKCRAIEFMNCPSVSFDDGIQTKLLH